MNKDRIVQNLMSDMDELIKNHYQDAFCEALAAAGATEQDQRIEACMIFLDAQKKHFASTLKADIARLTSLIRK